MLSQVGFDTLGWKFLGCYDVTTTSQDLQLPNAHEWLIVIGAKNNQQVYGGKSFVIPATESNRNIIQTGELRNGGGAVVSTDGVYCYISLNSVLTYQAQSVVTGNFLLMRVYYR